MTKKILPLFTLSLVLVACSTIPKEAYYSRGNPESLLDVSSEVVNFKIDSPNSVKEITNWVNQDQPTRAELNCAEGNPLCSKVQKTLHQFGVPVKYTATADNSVVLVYERVLARDCESRYIDNSVNPYNLHYLTFGCSISANAVQMVSDKHQFTNPALLDYPDARKAVQTVGAYNNAVPAAPTSDTSFTPLATQTNFTNESK